MDKDIKNKDDYIVKEAIRGLIIGFLLMVFVFSFVHFVLGFQAFS
ncbi:hypothetical protein [Anaerobacillus arseniciselenatis]|nr:hypothetical protein [Anaerobacillus arseniciselenatis]